MTTETEPAALAARVVAHTQTLEETIAAVEAWAGVLDGYVVRTFQAGIDFGAVKGTTKGGAEFEGKPVLLKPGAEKLTLALGLRATFVQDTETYAMAGSPAGLIALKCLLVDRAGEVVGEGRGAASIQEKQTINLAVKFAEKRAQIDAILRHTGLSGRFEGEERGRATTKPRPARSQPPSPAPAAPAAPAGTAPPSSASADPDGLPAPAGVRDQQVRVIRALLQRLGWDEAAFVAQNGAVPLPQLTAVRAQAMIDKLQTRVRGNGGQAA